MLNKQLEFIGWLDMSKCKIVSDLKINCKEIFVRIHGQASKIAGFSRPEFMKILAKYKIPVAQYSEEVGL